MKFAVKHLATGAVLASAALSAHATEPVKVFLMIGQSNMQGYGRLEFGRQFEVGGIGTLRYAANNTTPDSAYDYASLLADPSSPTTSPWATRSDVWVWNRSEKVIQNELTSTTTMGDHGPMYGVDSDRFGPDYGFGNVLGDYYENEQVVLVKTAWGGKSLAVDFRPPSAVEDRPQNGNTVGTYYNLVLSSYQEALVDIAAQFPGHSIELTGIGWHQGWNDRVTAAYNAEYEENLADLIVDLREDLGAPSDLPFVVATTGMGGWDATGDSALSLMNAQLAMNDAEAYPEFAGNVTSVDTRDFWRDPDDSPSGVQGYHWNQNGESFYLIGDAMGEAMVGLVPEPSSLILLGVGGLTMLRRRRYE